METALAATLAPLQLGPGPGPGVETGLGAVGNLVGGAVGAFLTTLVVGAIMVALAPEYTERMMAQVRSEPLACAGYGLVSLVFVVLVTVVLVITIIGILLAIPFALLAGLTWAVGAAVAFLAIAERLVGHEDGWTKPLVVAAALNGALALTGIGGLVAFGVGATGFGAILRGWLA
jgi:hypothetical protein